MKNRILFAVLLVIPSLGLSRSVHAAFHASADTICGKLDDPKLSASRLQSLLDQCQKAILKQQSAKSSIAAPPSNDPSLVESQELPELIPQTEPKSPTAEASPANSAVRS